eukprot:Nk52_evm9s160 gene=Nk52_evmTU9s160
MPVTVSEASNVVYTSAAIEDNILSSIHGRERRILRSIDKVDLLNAVKYGVKERCGANRWKYTFANVVFITENDSKTEVTSYALPIQLPHVEITDEDDSIHKEIRMEMLDNAHQVTAYTVVVIDQSGSMRTCDVDHYITRSDACFGTLALDFVADRIDSGESEDGLELMTLLGMKDHAYSYLYCEPITRVLYKKIDRFKWLFRPSGHGHYCNSLKTAKKMIMDFERKRFQCYQRARKQSMDCTMSDCVYTLLFMTDGRPSEHILGGPTALNDTLKILNSCAGTFRQRFHFEAVGMTKNQSSLGEFGFLNKLVTQVRRCGAKATFHHDGMKKGRLGTIMRSVSSNISSTCSQLTSLAIDAALGPVRSVGKEDVKIFGNSKVCQEKDWKIFTDDVRRLTWACGEDEGRERIFNYYVHQPLFTDYANGVAMRKKYFAEGAERFCYQFSEVKRVVNNVYVLTGPLLVAKESKRELQTDEHKAKFHDSFCRTQLKARKIARYFNKQIKTHYSLKGWHDAQPPRIEFLYCSVYHMANLKESGIEGREVLVEEMLENPSKFQKWNSNNGKVFFNNTCDDANGALQAPGRLTVGSIFDSILASKSKSKTRKVKLATLDEVPQCEEREFEDMEASDTEMDDLMNAHKASSDSQTIELRDIKEEDFPQAFSHYSHICTSRQLLICDLQGELTKSRDGGAVFRLTDPAIHVADRDSYKTYRPYGLTDKGRQGIRRFYQTHECTSVCKLLGLPVNMRK